MLKKIKSRIAKAINTRFYQFVNRHGRIHQALAFCMAMSAFGFLYSFPIAIVAGVLTIVATLMSPLSLLSLIPIGLSLVFIGVGALMTYRLITIRFMAPEGLNLENVKFHALFQLVDEVQEQYKLAKVDRIILTEPYSIEMYKTPLNGFAYWSKNTLMIGLPLMQTLSQEYFEILVRRKLIQYSKRHNAISNWINQLRNIWPLYAPAFKARKAFGDRLFAWFFTVFAPSYEYFTRRCAQLDELHADKNALDMVNAEELLKTIETMVISETFLLKKYWPNIQNAARSNPKATPPPYNKISELTAKTIAGIDKQKWLIQHLNKEAMKQHNGIKPPLKSRMHELGCTTVEIPEVMKQSAAQFYLGETYPKIVTLLNKKWMNRILTSLQKAKAGANPVVPMKKKPSAPINTPAAVAAKK